MSNLSLAQLGYNKSARFQYGEHTNISVKEMFHHVGRPMIPFDAELFLIYPSPIYIQLRWSRKTHLEFKCRTILGLFKTCGDENKKEYQEAVKEMQNLLDIILDLSETQIKNNYEKLKKQLLPPKKLMEFPSKYKNRNKTMDDIDQIGTQALLDSLYPIG